MAASKAAVLAQFNKTYPKHMTGTSGATMSPIQLRQLFEAVGFSPKLALQMMQITKGESSFMPGIQQTDPGDGNVGYGLTQVTPHAWGPEGVAHMNALGGIKAMFNPVKNAEMAKWLSDQAAKGGGNPLAPWYGTRYLNRNPGPVHSVLGMASGSAPAAGAPTVKPAKATPQGSSTPSTPLSDPRQLAAVALLLGQQGPYGQNTQALQLIQQNLTAQQQPVAAPKTPKVRSTSVTPQTPDLPTSPTTSSTGSVQLASGANRSGVNIQPIEMKFLKLLAGDSKRTVEVGTGTNHNQFVAGEPGVQSWHWTGHAADLPVGGDARSSASVAKKGDLIAAHALVVAGIPWSQAIKLAQAGGVHNVTPTSGPFKGHRIQVLWKTMTGGNHYNHVHVGVM